MRVLDWVYFLVRVSLRDVGSKFLYFLLSRFFFASECICEVVEDLFSSISLVSQVFGMLFTRH